MTKRQFEDAIQRGKRGRFAAASTEELKEWLAIALKAKADEYLSQQEAAISWGVSQPTISAIIRGKLERFSAGFLIDLLLKSGARLDVQVA